MFQNNVAEAPSMRLEVSGDDLRNRLSHVKYTIKGGRKYPLYIEIYDNGILLVYRDVEMSVELFNPTGTEHKLRAVYAITDYTLLYKIIKQFKDFQSYTLDFYRDYIRIKTDKSKFDIKASLQKQ